MQDYRLLLLCALVLSTCYDVEARSAGPPASVCNDVNQAPSHSGNAPQNGASPYTLTVDVMSYTPGSTTPITGKISDSSTFTM